MQMKETPIFHVKTKKQIGFYTFKKIFMKKQFDYKPDRWAVVKITPEKGEAFFKLIGVWKGGYLWGDHWRVNSGILQIDQVDDYLYFVGHSGSIYCCHVDMETPFDPVAVSLLNSMKKVGEQINTQVEIWKVDETGDLWEKRSIV